MGGTRLPLTSTPQPHAICSSLQLLPVVSNRTSGPGPTIVLIRCAAAYSDEVGYQNHCKALLGTVSLQAGSWGCGHGSGLSCVIDAGIEEGRKWHGILGDWGWMPILQKVSKFTTHKELVAGGTFWCQLVHYAIHGGFPSFSDFFLLDTSCLGSVSYTSALVSLFCTAAMPLCSSQC